MTAASRRAAAATAKGVRPASSLRNDSLGRRQRGSRSLKRAACRSLGPKQAVAPVLRDERRPLPWATIALSTARRRERAWQSQQLQAACTSALHQVVPLSSLCILGFAEGTLKHPPPSAIRHPSQCTAWRQGQGRPKRAVYSISGIGAATQNASAIEHRASSIVPVHRRNRLGGNAASNATTQPHMRSSVRRICPAELLVILPPLECDTALFYALMLLCSVEMLAMLFSYPLPPRAKTLYPTLWDVPLYNRNSSHITRICRTVQQRDNRNDVCWLEQMPACQCLLGARANRDREDVVDWQLGLT